VKTQPTPQITLVKVDPENLAECGIGCLTNRKHPGYGEKEAWLRERFAEGLRFLLFRSDKGKPLAFLEYVPGEYAWRPVDAPGWIFVHCLWVYSAGQKVGGLGSRLIQACLDEARESDALGVAALVSDGPWMAGAKVFLKNGFRQIAERDRFELVAHRLKEGPEPRFRELGVHWVNDRGLHLVYSAQCPMLPKSALDLGETAAENGLELKVTKLDSADEAQTAPSYYGVFNLLWNGRLLSDHYVSRGRFKNILKNEILGREE
jgi:hypothetical protein